MHADRAAVERARLKLAYCTIRSPLDGRTGSLLVQQGNVVKANDDGPLVVINHVDPIYVTFSVPERRLAEIRPRTPAGRLSVEALVPGEEARPLAGELSFVDNAVDPTTGTILLKGRFAQQASAALARAVRRRAARDSGAGRTRSLVPAPAVQTGQAGTFVFVVQPDHTVEARRGRDGTGASTAR